MVRHHMSRCACDEAGLRRAAAYGDTPEESRWCWLMALQGFLWSRASAFSGSADTGLRSCRRSGATHSDAGPGKIRFSLSSRGEMTSNILLAHAMSR